MTESCLFHFVLIDLCKRVTHSDLKCFLSSSFSSRCFCWAEECEDLKICIWIKYQQSCPVVTNAFQMCCWPYGFVGIFPFDATSECSGDLARPTVTPLRSNQTSNQRANPLEPSDFLPVIAAGRRNYGQGFWPDKISSRLLIPEDTWLEKQTLPPAPVSLITNQIVQIDGYFSKFAWT